MDQRKNVSMLPHAHGDGVTLTCCMQLGNVDKCRSSHLTLIVLHKYTHVKPAALPYRSACDSSSSAE